MRKTFTPNMDPNAVAELDYRRGYGDVGKYTNPSPINRKEPWNVKTPDHTPRDQEVIEPEADPTENDIKQPEADMQSPVNTAMKGLQSWLAKHPDINKGVDACPHCKNPACDHDHEEDGETPYDEAREGEHSEELEHAKKALSGWDIKQKQLKREAVSKPKPSYVGGNPKPAAPVAKPRVTVPKDTSSSQGNYSLGEEDGEDLDKASAFESVVGHAQAAHSAGHKDFSPKTHSALSEAARDLAPSHAKDSASHMARAAHHTKMSQTTSGANRLGHQAMAHAHTSHANRNFSSGGSKTPWHGGSKPSLTGVPTMTGQVHKALSTRSFAIPRPMGEYDPFGIQRSATSIPSDMQSKLPKPEGFAPAVRQTLDDVSHRNLTIKGMDTKTCSIHGINFDVNKGCHPCAVTKSMSCSECGEQKVKRPGGMASCPKGHEGSKDASY